MTHGAVREEQYLWFRVAENSFDNFVYAKSARRAEPGLAIECEPAFGGLRRSAACVFS